MRWSAVGIIAVMVAMFLGGCAYPEPYPVYGGGPYGGPYGAPVVAQRSEYGVVEAIQLYRPGSNAPIGLGAIIGGIAGGIIGHQFGSGSGNTAATIAGALAGGAIGNEVQRANAGDRYRVIVRLDSGASVALDQVGEGELRVGDRVRIVGNRVYRY